MRRRSPLLSAAAALAAATVLTTSGCSAQPVIAIVRIGPAPVEFRVEVAQTAGQQRDGLTGKEPLLAGSGMLFQFGNSAEQKVWMAGMTNPLDAAWIADGKVLAVDTLTPCSETDQDSCPLWTSPSAVDALLEVPAGSLATVVPGMSVTIRENPS